MGIINWFKNLVGIHTIEVCDCMSNIPTEIELEEHRDILASEIFTKLIEIEESRSHYIASSETEELASNLANKAFIYANTYMAQRNEHSNYF